MTKPTDPVETLARLVRDAQVEAWLDLDANAARRAWAEMEPSGQRIYLAVARHLLAAGVRVPAGAMVPARKPPDPPKES